MSMSSMDFPNLRIFNKGSIPASTLGPGGGATSIAELTDVQITEPLLDGQVFVWNNTIEKWTNVDPSLITTGELTGTTTRSGDASTTTFTVAHGLGKLPTKVVVNGISTDADDDFSWTVDDTNITITYDFPPPTGTDNLSFYYRVA